MNTHLLSGANNGHTWPAGTDSLLHDILSNMALPFPVKKPVFGVFEFMDDLRELRMCSGSIDDLRDGTYSGSTWIIHRHQIPVSLKGECTYLPLGLISHISSPPSAHPPSSPSASPLGMYPLCLRMRSSRQARVAHSRHRVLPVPVGDSRIALVP